MHVAIASSAPEPNDSEDDTPTTIPDADERYVIHPERSSRTDTPKRRDPFDVYKPIRPLGEGGLAEVWLVAHRQLGLQFALKRLLPNQEFNRKSRRRFFREMKLMAKLVEHHAIVGIRDAGQGLDGTPFIVMDYLRGRTLADFLVKGQPMDLRWIVQLLTVLCGAVQHAHDQGVLHRDLKPANLLFAGAPGEAADLKVSDFGLAKAFGRRFNHRGSTTETGSFLGSPPYTSPEQAECKRVDERGDVYSIGVILYELLTGHRPFSGNQARMIADTLTTPAPAFAAINPKVRVPIEVERVVLRCLEKDPAARYMTVRMLLGQFVEAIERTEARDQSRGIPRLLNSAFGFLSRIG